MLARLSAFVIWSIVAATLMFWALRLGVSGTAIPAHAVAVDRSAPLRGDLARLFGAAPLAVAAGLEAPPEPPSRFRLVGVMAPRGAQEGEGRYGLALIAVDGKPARAYPVGATLDGDLVLQAVSLRTASVGPAQGGRSTLLELPALPPAATGVLPPGIGMAAPPAPAPPPAAMPPRPVPSAAPAVAPAPAGVPPAVAPAMQSTLPVPPGSMSPAAGDNFRTQ